MQYRAFNGQKSNQRPDSSLVKEFESEVRVNDNKLGFTNCNTFLPRPLIERMNIKDGDHIKGKAILNFNKKRSEWSWMAFEAK
jgi:hypothetical protein